MKKLYVVYKVMPNGAKHEVKRFIYRTACLNFCLKYGYRFVELKEVE